MRYIDYYFFELKKCYYSGVDMTFIFKIMPDNKFKKIYLRIKTFNKRIILRCYQTGFG